MAITTDLTQKKVNGESNVGVAQTTGYTPVNATAAPGVDYEAYLAEVAKQKEYLAANGIAEGADNSDIYEKYADIVNSTLSGLGGNSATGYYTQDGANAQKAASQYGATVTPTTYNGQTGWYEVDGTNRTTQEGTSGADEDLLSDGSYAVIQQLKAEWAAANEEYQKAVAAGDTELAAQYKAAMEQAHANAERIRANAGYTGGTDGSQYLTNGATGIAAAQSGSDTGAGTGTGLTSSPESRMQSLLDQWKAAALQQSNGQVDYAVAQAVLELERALEDAQSQYREQTESVYKDEMQALDNSALYAEARGDKGGIGQSQYNEIQAAAAQNRLAVQQAQTKLSTDTARQIADLRAQGEFDKADAALEISQQYLAQLISLEQWAAEFGLSQQQFQASLQQWQAEYDLAMAQFEVDTELSYASLTGRLGDGTLTLEGQSQLASMGEAMLSSGIMPSSEQLSAMGMTESQAQEYLTALQLEEAAKKYSSSSSSETQTKPNLTWAQTKAEIEDGNFNDTVLAAYEYYMGVPYDMKGKDNVLNLESNAVKTAKAYIDRGIWSGEDIITAIEAAVGKTISEEEAIAILNYAGL